MRYNVGVDFGTHQTKVCIEDSINKRVPVYKFLEFQTPEGTSTVLFPSVVQINNNQTVSYGFVDRNQCMHIRKEATEPPQLVLPTEPKLELPAEPIYQKVPQEPAKEKPVTKGDWATVIESLASTNSTKSDIEHKKWEEKKKEIELSNFKKKIYWKQKCEVVRKKFQEEEHKKWEDEVERAKQKYAAQMRDWRKENRSEELYFRYFKQASFFNSFAWEHRIEAETISILYLTYLCFCIKEDIGYDFTTQFGAPMGASAAMSQQQRKVAKKIWSTAVNLSEYYKTKSEFLSAKIDDLLQKVKEVASTDSRATIIPEASAGLLSIRNRIGRGIFLLVDIGGGTTDVGMCSIRQDKSKGNKLGIHKVCSFNMGLNYIFEKYQESHPEMSLIEIQDLFQEQSNHTEFSEAIQKYHSNLRSQLKGIVDQIINNFTKGKHFHHLTIKENLEPAIENKTIYFCGGGSVFEEMRKFNTKGLYFADKKPINKTLLDIQHLSNAASISDEFYPMLATAYGLSKQVDLEEELDEIELERFFDHLPKADKPEFHNDISATDDLGLQMGTN